MGENRIGDLQVIHGNPPSKSNSYRIVTINGHASLSKMPILKNYEKMFFIQCGKYRDANIEGYFRLSIDVYYQNQRSDLDNVLKVVLDCLQAVRAFKNDNKCTEIHARKFLDKSNPRIEFRLTPEM